MGQMAKNTTTDASFSAHSNGKRVPRQYCGLIHCNVESLVRIVKYDFNVLTGLRLKRWGNCEDADFDDYDMDDNFIDADFDVEDENVIPAGFVEF